MEKLEQIQEQLEPILRQFNVELYEMNWQKTKSATTLQIAIMHHDGSMDLDTCANVSEAISAMLDETDCITEEYFLEVCSPGAERRLRNLQDVQEATGKKVFIELHKEVKGYTEISGILVSCVEGILQINYKDKAASRKIELAYDNIKLIRLAV